MQRLPEQQRSALLMRELDGLSYTELADALRTSVSAVKSLLVRARIGLVEAGEARDTACADIRSELARAQRRGVRASGRSRRHLRDCHGCRDYRQALRAVDHGLAALQPGPAGPLSTVAKLLGLGGASSGAAAGASAGGSAAMVGGATAATATKVAAIVCCAAVVGGGAVEVREHVAPVKRAHHSSPPARAARAATAPARAVTVTAPIARVSDPPRGHDAAAAAAKRGEHTVKADPQATNGADTATGTGTVAVTPAEAQTGGTLAPDEAPTPDPVVAAGDASPPPASPVTPADPATASAPPAVPTDPAATGAAAPAAPPPTG
jgi:hypothetical protein